MNSTPVVVVPRCETCNGKFYLHTKTFCIDCGDKIHRDCAYEDYCVDCYNNKRIEEELKQNGILLKVEGDDDLRVFKGKTFWDIDDKIHICYEN